MTLNSSAGSLLGKIAGYVEILAKDPRSTVFVSLAECYRQMGLLDDALEVASKGVQVLPAFSPGYSILGRIHFQRGNHEAAAAAFERALLIDPENLLSLKGLARLRLQQGDRSQALKLVRRAVALKPDDPALQKMLETLGPPAAVHEAAVEPVSAAAAAHPPTDPISTPTIAEIYIRQGFLGRAMKVYRDLLQADPHNEVIRQRLVELKQRIETQNAPPSPDQSPVPAAPAPDTAPAAGSETAAVCAVPQSAGTKQRQLAELSRWLESISRRKIDVQ